MKHLFDITTKYPKLNPLRTEPLPSDYWNIAEEVGARQQLALIRRLADEMWPRSGLITSLQLRNKSFISPLMLDILSFDTSTGMGKTPRSWGIGGPSAYVPKSSIGPFTFSLVATVLATQEDLRGMAQEWCEEVKRFMPLDSADCGLGGGL